MVPFSACEFDDVCQDVLLHHDKASAPLHIFADLCATPPAAIMERLSQRLKTLQAFARISQTSASTLSHSSRSGARPSLSGSASTPVRATIKDVGLRWVRESMEILSAWAPTREDQGA